jgi:hypothetical protein
MEREPNKCSEGWTFKREVSIPNVLTLLLIFASVMSAYFIHDTRISILEARQTFVLRHVEELSKEVGKVGRLEEKIDALNANICDVKEALKQLRREGR